MKRTYCMIPITLSFLLLSCATTIHKAAESGNTPAVTEFLTKGADPNERDANGYTPLHLALSRNHPETASALIAAGADVNAIRYGWPPLVFAVIAREQEMVKVLIDKGADPAAFKSVALMYAVLGTEDASPKPEIVRLLVKGGADVNGITENHVPPLWTAVQFGTLDVVKELIDLGADVDYVFSGDPPLGGMDLVVWAKICKRPEIAKAILDAKLKKQEGK